MIKREAKFTTIFAKYLEKSRMIGFFELKQTSAKSLPYSSIEEHQYEGLRAAQNNGFRWKLSDADPRTKPFDYIATMPLYSYIVVKWKDVATIIKFDDFVAEKNKKERKSITQKRAMEIAVKVIHM